MYWIALLILAIIVGIIAYRMANHGAHPDGSSPLNQKSINQLAEYPYEKKCFSQKPSTLFTIY